MPSVDVGAEVRRNRDLNCWPWVRSLTHSPIAVIYSPAEIVAAWPTTVTSSRCPRAFARRTQKPFSVLWNVTRSTSPASTSWVDDSGCGFIRIVASSVLLLHARSAVARVTVSVDPAPLILCYAFARYLSRTGRGCANFSPSVSPARSIRKDSVPMTISMYKASAPIFVQFLTSLSAVLDKAAAHAEAKKIDPAVLLNMRLNPDMYPLARQVREATNHAARACGGVAGADQPTFTNTEASIPELKERIARTIDFIKGLKPAQIDGTEDKEITIKFPSGAERKFTGQALLLNFCLPIFYFQHTTAYDILRHCGVEVGKRDFMGTPVTLA